MVINCLNSESSFRVLFSESLLEKMIRLAKEFYPNEFGGILTGIKEKNCWIITDIEVPTKYESNKSNFVRYPNFLNDYLQKIFDISNSKIEYLGEWHTHPNGSTQFSSQDLLSMRDIAENSEINNRTPLLIILGLNKDVNYQCYYFIGNQLVKLNIDPWEK